MFWSPAHCAHVLPLRALKRPATASTAFDLDALNCRKTVIVTDNGAMQHVLLESGACQLQLCVSGADIRRPVGLVTEAIWPSCWLRQRLEGLECLNRFCANKTMPARHSAPDPRGRRFGIILQALDGWLSGASHREIAIALWGRERVTEDWMDPGDHLRDRVRRAIGRGRTLMRGGYLDFLS